MFNYVTAFNCDKQGKITLTILVTACPNNTISIQCSGKRIHPLSLLALQILDHVHLRPRIITSYVKAQKLNISTQIF